MPTYNAPVTRIETFDIGEGELNRERIFQFGKSERLAGKPCASVNGAYLNGWYSPEIDFYYIPRAAAHLL